MAGNSAEDVWNLLRYIREFIQHPRRLDPIIQKKPSWYMLTAAMDVVSDTESAIVSYERGEFRDKGTLYLVIYGLLQAMYLQQDALRNMVHALEGSEVYKLDTEPEAMWIRQIRNDSVGHPTKQGTTKPRKDGALNEQTSHSIVQHSMRKEHYTLLRSSNLADTSFVDINVLELIEKNRVLAIRILARTKANFEAIEMEHRANFKGEKLASIFHPTMSYQFEKVFEGINNPSCGRHPYGQMSLEVVVKYFNDFKAALQKRGILNESGHLHYNLDEAEYALSELTNYYNGAGLLTDKRAALIFNHFAQHKMRELERIAKEIDEEYEEEIPAGVGA
jgi:hypothetical protein